jgi:alpha-glucosidase
VASRIGVQESQALFVALLALPGSLYIYNGQELSLPDAQVADQYRQDPVFFRTNGEQKGRDGARVPLPWNSQESEIGFTHGKPWLPIPQSWQELSIDKQEEDAASSLHLYRHALQARHQYIKDDREIFWRETGIEGVLVFERGDLLVLLNTSSEEKFYPVSGDLLLSSHSGVTSDGKIVKLPKATACWVSRLP